MMNKLEIPVNSKEEAIIAEAGGADRLEISLFNEIGGITPTLEEISDVIANTKLPCYLFIRPTEETWQVTEEEFQGIMHFIDIAKIVNLKGISIGILKDGKIDREKLEAIIEVKGNLEIVFNHAIDSVYNYEEELKYLIDNEQVDWIQTSGSSRTIFDGYKRILPFLDEIKDKLIIGKHLNSRNVSKLLEAGFENVVFQAKGSLTVGDKYTKTLSLDEIKEFVRVIKGEQDE